MRAQLPPGPKHFMVGKFSGVTMNVLIAAILLLAAAAIAITATITAVLAFRRGESLWKTLKAWLAGMFDAISGVG